MAEFGWTKDNNLYRLSDGKVLGFVLHDYLFHVYMSYKGTVRLPDTYTTLEYAKAALERHFSKRPWWRIW